MQNFLKRFVIKESKKIEYQLLGDKGFREDLLNKDGRDIVMYVCC